MVKRYTARLVHTFQSHRDLVRLSRLLPYLFLIAALIINTLAWVNEASWHYSVLNPWLLAGWIVYTSWIYSKKSV